MKHTQRLLNNILLGFIGFMIIPIITRFIHSSDSPFYLYANFLLLGFFVLLYFINKKTEKSFLVANIFLILLYLIIVLMTYYEQVKGLFLIYFLIVAMLSYILLPPKNGLLYSFLSLLSLVSAIMLFPDALEFDQKYRLITSSIVITIISHTLGYYREKAFKETEYYIKNMEDKVAKALKSEQEQKKLLVQTSKLASLGQMLSSIAHQWKQPITSLSAININFQMAEQLSNEPNKERVKLIEEMQKQIEFMNNTMENFRSFFKSKDEKGVFSLDISSCKLIDLFRKEFKINNIDIEYKKVDLVSLEVVGYENMYQQALLNIISNAKDAILEQDAQNKKIDIEFSHDEDSAIIVVQDHAGGIPDDIIDNIFDKQFTTKGDKGTGIGLAMSKEIIEDFCNGELSVENSQDGAKFTIYLPLSKSL